MFLLLPVAFALDKNWLHSMDDLSQMWFSDFGYSLLTQDEARFVASHNQVVSVEKCTGREHNLTTQQAIYRQSQLLKSIKPSIKVLFYWSMTLQGIDCYAAKPEPAWHLKDDNGNVVTPYRVDYSIAEARAWWLSVPMSGKDASRLVDGVLADGAGYQRIANISQARLKSIYGQKLSLLKELQLTLRAINGGIVLANGLAMYSFVQDHNIGLLESVDAVMDQHLAVFEQVDHSNHSLIPTLVETNLATIQKASQSSQKLVFVSGWPGLLTSFHNNYPVWSNNSQPQSPSEWARIMPQMLSFPLSLFLLIANNNTYFSYAIWYQKKQGFVNCYAQPETCATPNPWYSQVNKALGRPLGGRVKVGDFVWTRRFEKASVRVDIKNGVGNIEWAQSL